MNFFLFYQYITHTIMKSHYQVIRYFSFSCFFFFFFLFSILFSSLAKALEDRAPNLLGVLCSINTTPNAGFLVVADDGGSLSMVSDQSPFEGLGVIIRTLDQKFAGDIVLHCLFGGVENLVVRSAGSRMDETAGDTVNEEFIVNLELDGVLQGGFAVLQHGVKTLGLGNGTGETVQNESILAFLVVFQLVLDHVDHDFI